jgi:probable phosphoglycerate mutase
MLCVRHGLSTWNLVRRWQGQADPPLSDAGRDGAAALGRALADLLGGTGTAHVWSSDLARARDTATILAAALGAPPVTVDTRLREADIGPWQGLTAVEIEAGWPDFLADGRRPPGFEQDAELLARVVPALEAIAEQAAAASPELLPVVVSHAGVLRSLRRRAGALDEHLANLTGMWFDVGPGELAFRGVFDAGIGPGLATPPPL